MSPKTLNVEKLEKKFASLTKSRESILGLSTWIIRHKEFYKEIVDQWLTALSKDKNPLTMFYVANDVIQNCGRKKAPEFREAFGAVLERAVSLEKVKEIKAEVTRMVTLWYERSIYDAAFYKKLQDKLNDIEESESEEELDETDIIANFKLESLTESLEKLKTLEEELLDKEEFLEDIEEPGITNIDNLIVKMDSQKELRKVDKFQKLVESYLSLADKVMNAQKEAMLNLKYSSIFYRAQLEDAKKVAHAYRIYGKKVKMVEKALNEKLPTLPEASPVLEEKSPNAELNLNVESQSPGFSITSDAVNESSNQSSNLDLNTSPKMNENDSFMNINILSDKYKSPLIETQTALFSATKDLCSENKIIKSSTVVSMPNTAKEEEKTIESSAISVDEKILKSPLINIASKKCEKSKSPLIHTVSKKNDKISKSPVITDLENTQTIDDASKNNEKMKSPLITEKVRRTSTDQKSKTPIATETLRKTSTDQKLKNTATVETVRRTSTDQKSKSPVTVEEMKKTSNNQKSKSPLTIEETRRTSTDQKSKNSVAIETIRRTSTDQKSKSPITVEAVRKTSTEQKSKSPVTVEAIRRTSTDQKSKSPITVEAVRKTSTEQKSKSPVTVEAIRSTSTDQKLKSPVAIEAVRRTSIDKVHKCITSSSSSENIFDKNKDTTDDITDSLNSNLEEEKLKTVSPGNENSAKKICSLENEENLSTSKESKKSSESDLQSLSDIENIDFLLEKSYNEQRTKSKASFKRKIDNLLKMKQSKACKLSNDDDSSKRSKTSSETSVTEDLPIVSSSILDSGEKSDASESLVTKKENIVNSGDNEKINLPPESEQADHTKADQFPKIQNTQTSDSNVAEITPQPTSTPFSNFPDIPTELLKNILDKHRTSINQSSNADSSCVTSGLPGVEPENMKLSDSVQNNTNCNITASDKKDASSELMSTSALDSKTNDIENNIQEKSLQDNGNSEIANKNDLKTDTEDATKNNSTVKMTPLMENLQKLLKCFTEKGPAFEELKNSKTLKTLPTYSLRSTLKLYHVLKEHHKSDNTLNSSNVNNSLPSCPPETAPLQANKSSVCNYNNANAFVHSKNDNLEIMDMDVDSDDDSTK